MRLAEPVRLGALALPNRIVMAPLTRTRAGEERIPNAMMATYYAQRASAGLILSEATCVSAQGVGYASTPGIWSDAQVEGWKLTTKAVHEAGGRIMLQLWHVGRISDPTLLGGEMPVAPSAIAASGHVSILRPQRPYPVPRALETSEIAGIVADFRKGAENAKRAGFDGVEVHAANGYLIDQFLQDSTNRRTDSYGGSVENRARFLLEITDACASVWGADRVGVHLSPRGQSHDITDSNPKATFGHVAAELGKRRIAFLFVREKADGEMLLPQLKRQFGGPVIANQDMTAEIAERLIHEGSADAVAFGRQYIANPDLACRLLNGAAFNTPDASTFYGQGPKGYIDYPALG